VEPTPLTPESDPFPRVDHREIYHPDALTSEGQLYRVNVRTVLWVIVLALLLAFVGWWAWT
jgi:hypothetical protein